MQRSNDILHSTKGLIIMLKRTFRLSGSDYSMNKTIFKAVMKKHEIRWCGSLQLPKWATETEIITAEFERENDVTKAAVIVWTGPVESEFLKEFTKALKFFTSNIITEGTEEEVPVGRGIEEEVEEKLMFWDTINRPDIESMRKPSHLGTHRGAPASYIEFAVKEWKRKRALREIEIREELANESKPKATTKKEKIVKDKVKTTKIEVVKEQAEEGTLLSMLGS